MITSNVLAAAATLSLLGASPAVADTGKPEAKTDKKICRDVGPPTGSILARKKACLTKAQWAEVDKANANNMRRFQADRERSLAPDAVR